MCSVWHARPDCVGVQSFMCNMQRDGGFGQVWTTSDHPQPAAPLLQKVPHGVRLLLRWWECTSSASLSHVASWVHGAVWLVVPGAFPLLRTVRVCSDSCCSDCSSSLLHLPWCTKPFAVKRNQARLPCESTHVTANAFLEPRITDGFIPIRSSLQVEDQQSKI